jgi:hypothetical protein
MLAVAAQAQENGGTLKGRVTDSSGAVVPGAVVVVTARGVERTAATDQTGSYTVTGLAPATYAVRITAAGFGVFRSKADIAGGRVATLDASLVVALEKQEVTVEAEGTPAVSTEASNNAGALVLRGSDLDALADDPDDMEADLQALAGPSAGPSGGEIYVDGFTNARLPPKASIREIRINQNPFSSEYDRLGYGRIEILTKPGTDKFHGQVMFNDSDAVFNSRNPYADNKPDFHSRQYGGNLTGPISKKASFFMDFERRDIAENALINAVNPDPALVIAQPDWATNPPRIQDAVVTPIERTTLSPRLDYQLTKNQTLVARYSYERSSRTNAGLGSGFSLADQAYDSLDTEHDASLTDTMVLSPRTINESRFHFEQDVTEANGKDGSPTLTAPEFVTGGVAAGHSLQTEKHYELQNFTTIAKGAHGLKFGMRLRALTLDDSSLNNFMGTYYFASLLQYQQAVLGKANPTQYTRSLGTAFSSLSRIDAAPFFQDDWRMRPNLTLSLGLRYETQTNIHDWHDIAPRIGFAWSPDGGSKGNGKTVVRGGFGMFYDRFSQDLTLEANRYNGTTQQSFVVPDPTFFPNVPTPAQLEAQATGRAWLFKVQPGLRAPRTMQSALGVERQLPWNTTVASTFMYAKGEHLLRSINALSVETVTQQVEANGAYRQTQWMTNVNSRLSKSVSFFAFYVLSKAMSDTDGAWTFPADANNLAQEWGRSSLDVRHRFMLAGSLMTRWGVRLSPFITARSGAPFNITTGVDNNGDTEFTDRPSKATAGQAGAIHTQWGWFNLDPAAGPVIPRNYGQSPGYFAVNLRVSKVFGFGEARSAPTPGFGGGGPGGPRGGGPGGPPMMGGGGGRGGGMRGMFSDPLTDHRFNLTLSVSARNLLNSTNPGAVTGNLSSEFFGQSLSLANAFGPVSGAGNRRLEMGLRFSF